jgi:CubicO group peptidase (beta-lactamase class C family)
MPLREEVDELAQATRFSGVVRVDRGGATELAAAYREADRAHAIANTVDTQFAIASGVKGMTAATVMSLVADGTLSLTTTARSLLGVDLPLIDDAVTVEHLLGHRSGIGDYLDEESMSDIDDYPMPVPVHQLDTTESFVQVLDGYATKFSPDERFSYCNGGYVVLALLAERASKVPFHDLVAQRVLAPASMADTAFLRSDELPGRAAIGYLAVEGRRTNVLHLPVRGNGDGGIYTTAADVSAFWEALLGGRLIPPDLLQEMTRERSEGTEEHPSYGLGFWLRPARGSIMLTGYDAGVSFRTVHQPVEGVTFTVMSNTSEGAWPMGRLLDGLLGV